MSTVSETASVLGDMVEALPDIWPHHAPTDRIYRLLKHVARREVEELFRPAEAKPHPFGPFGQIRFPYHNMGNIDSLDLFGIDELIVLSFYWANRRLYKRVADLGANIGLHSFAMARAGFRVRSFEPDPVHFKLLNSNLVINNCCGVETIEAAISVTPGTHEFVRVLGNTTGSHLAGAKRDPYGELERFEVRLTAFADELAWADLIKMDIEGHEAKVLASTGYDDWQTTDAVIEVGNEQNAAAIFAHFMDIDVNLFAQKIGWGRVRNIAAMPTSHREGSLFISARERMPWPER